jgi:DNA polymerase-3 subunit alpha
MTQYSMDPVAKLGLLKMDFLGLTNLTILDRAVKLVDKNRGVKIVLDDLPLDDQHTFDLLSSGNTTDLFQLESPGMRRYIKELKPSNIGDISAMIALYRPGPMENIDDFINSKFGYKDVEYPDPSLKELLDETYGIIVYQDQVLLILQQFAGYTLGEADIVRKAMGKKIASLMAEEREKFVAGAAAKGFEKSLATSVFDLIEPFAGYAFNKAHSVSYALISYWTGYFKTHYPLEYMAAVLNSRLDHPEKIVTSINECFRLGIPVLLPDINRSEEFFTIDQDSGPTPGIRVGLAAVKTVGEAAVRPLVEEREANGPFESIDDFCRRAGSRGLNRRTLESLTKAGAFDTLANRGAVLDSLDQIVAFAQLEAKSRSSGQSSLFDGASSEDGAGGLPGIELGDSDVPPEEKATWERELLGVALSYNPMWQLASLNAGDAFNTIDQLDDDMQGQTVSLLGHISAVNERFTKEQKKYFAVTLDLLGGTVEVMIWPNVLERTQQLWTEGKILRITGKLQLRRDQLSVVCDQAQEHMTNQEPSSNGNSNGNGNGKSNGNGNSNGKHSSNGYANGPVDGQPHSRPNPELAAANGGSYRTLSLAVKESDNAIEDAHKLREVIGVLLEYHGQDRVNLDIHTPTGRVILDLPPVNTGYCDELAERLSLLLGSGSVRVDSPQDMETA